jgi:hypothetical protein
MFGYCDGGDDVVARKSMVEVLEQPEMVHMVCPLQGSTFIEEYRTIDARADICTPTSIYTSETTSSPNPTS